MSTPTPEEQAAEAMRRHFGFAPLPGDWVPDGPEDGLPGLALCIADAIRAAVAAKRERIARMAKELEAVYEMSEPNPDGSGRVVECREFAAAIRQRGET